MVKYIALVCDNCGNASAARASAKSHVCPYCGRTIRVENARILTSGNSREVGRAVAAYNSRKNIIF